jgi:divalent metal cation (Fe/Co/Zn/Cd) transporter
MDTPPPVTSTNPSLCCGDARRGPSRESGPGAERGRLIRRAFRLEYVTVAWMVAEATVATWSGVRAGSVSLLAFGLDSLIELASAGVLIWRLIVELRHGQAFAESAERTASRVAGGLLFALAAYVVAAAAWSLWTRTGQDFSWPGLMVAACAMPVMYVLARRKVAVADALGSRAMRADAMEAIACGWLSLVVVVGLVVEWLTRAWWVDAMTSLGIVWFLIREGREAWNNEECACA